MQGYVFELLLLLPRLDSCHLWQGSGQSSEVSGILQIAPTRKTAKYLDLCLQEWYTTLWSYQRIQVKQAGPRSAIGRAPDS